jgi:hypothetical protein
MKAYLRFCSHTVFWHVTPCSLVVPLLFAGCLAYCSTLNMEAVRSSVTSVNFYTASHARTSISVNL